MKNRCTTTSSKFFGENFVSSRVRLSKSGPKTSSNYSPLILHTSTYRKLNVISTTVSTCRRQVTEPVSLPLSHHIHRHEIRSIRFRCSFFQLSMWRGVWTLCIVLRAHLCYVNKHTSKCIHRSFRASLQLYPEIFSGYN